MVLKLTEVNFQKFGLKQVVQSPVLIGTETIYKMKNFYVVHEFSKVPCTEINFVHGKTIFVNESVDMIWKMIHPDYQLPESNLTTEEQVELFTFVDLHDLSENEKQETEYVLSIMWNFLEQHGLVVDETELRHLCTLYQTKKNYE